MRSLSLLFCVNFLYSKQNVTHVFTLKRHLQYNKHHHDHHTMRVRERANWRFWINEQLYYNNSHSYLKNVKVLMLSVMNVKVRIIQKTLVFNDAPEFRKGDSRIACTNCSTTIKLWVMCIFKLHIVKFESIWTLMTKI